MTEYLRINIDGDLLIYTCGFAANNEPINHAKYNIMKIMEKCARACEEEGFFGMKPIIQINLSGPTNFREEIESPDGEVYKGHRDPNKKPVHFDDLYEYLKNMFTFRGIPVTTVISIDEEADDVMGIEQCKDINTSIICTLDKDLMMIPGRHFNWRHDKAVRYITGMEADKHFWTQMLTGDRSDNIKGIHGIGPAKAKKILCLTDDEIMKTQIGNRRLLRDRIHCGKVIAAYERAGLSPEQFVVNGRLLWIRRKEDELWEAPKPLVL